MAGRARGGDGTGREEKRGRDCTGDLAEGARVGVSAATLEPAVVQRLGVDTSAQSQPLLPGPVLRRIGDPSASGAPSDTSTVFCPFFVLRPADAGLRPASPASACPASLLCAAPEPRGAWACHTEGAWMGTPIMHLFPLAEPVPHPLCRCDPRAPGAELCQA